MNDLPFNIQRAVRRYEPIKTDSLTLYPVLVKEYDEFLMARPALEFMHQSLPVTLMRIPLLSAFYQMDYQAVNDGRDQSGMFSRALLGLALSLRLGEGMEPTERVGLFRIAVDRKDPSKLASLQFVDRDGKEKEIRPVQYKQIRQIIAAQNGVGLESDKANPNIVKAKRDMASLSSVTLNATVEDLISAVAALSGVDEADIDLWPIRKLDSRAETYRRILDYLVCGIGEVQGTTWKGGNPTPHPFFAKLDDGTGLFTSIGESAEGAAATELPQAAQALAETAKNLQLKRSETTL